MNSYSTKDFLNLLDEELVAVINDGSDSALQILVERYLPIIRNKASEISASFGIDMEDLVQESLIALYSCIKVYNPDLSTFSTFASLCIKRNLTSVCRAQLRKKQIPRDKILYDDNDCELLTDKNPESLLIEKEDSYYLTQKIKNILSDNEYKVLLAFIEYGSYDIISQKLGISVKSVNNCMCRIRNKFRKIY